MIPEEDSRAVAQALWGDFQEENDFPNRRPLLAHYTSLAVLEKIVRDGEIWFSNPLYMNDSEELQFGIIEGTTEFRINEEVKAACKTLAHHEKLLGFFEHWLHDFEANHVFDTYVLCLTEHEPDEADGILSMWRGYGDGGNGVAIVFGTDVLEAIEDSPLVIGRVHYGSRSERLDWIKKRLSVLANVLAGSDQTDEFLVFAGWHWLERLRLFALFSKHNGFRDEREWRVAYLSHRDTRGLLRQRLGYAVTSRGVEQKLKLKFEPIHGVSTRPVGIDGMIRKIILGPSISSGMAERATRRMLEACGHPELGERLVSSGIPFRPRVLS